MTLHICRYGYTSPYSRKFTNSCNSKQETYMYYTYKTIHSPELSKTVFFISNTEHNSVYIRKCINVINHQTIWLWCTLLWFQKVTWGVLVFLKFGQFASELTKTWSSDATECGV